MLSTHWELFEFRCLVQMATSLARYQAEPVNDVRSPAALLQPETKGVKARSTHVPSKGGSPVKLERAHNGQPVFRVTQDGSYTLRLTITANRSDDVAGARLFLHGGEAVPARNDIIDAQSFAMLTGGQDFPRFKSDKTLEQQRANETALLASSTNAVWPTHPQVVLFAKLRKGDIVGLQAIVQPAKAGTRVTIDAQISNDGELANAQWKLRPFQEPVTVGNLLANQFAQERTVRTSNDIPKGVNKGNVESVTLRDGTPGFRVKTNGTYRLGLTVRSMANAVPWFHYVMLGVTETIGQPVQFETAINDVVSEDTLRGLNVSGETGGAIFRSSHAIEKNLAKRLRIARGLRNQDEPLLASNAAVWAVNAEAHIEVPVNLFKSDIVYAFVPASPSLQSPMPVVDFWCKEESCLDLGIFDPSKSSDIFEIIKSQLSESAEIVGPIAKQATGQVLSVLVNESAEALGTTASEASGRVVSVLENASAETLKAIASQSILALFGLLTESPIIEAIFEGDRQELGDFVSAVSDRSVLESALKAGSVLKNNFASDKVAFAVMKSLVGSISFSREEIRAALSALSDVPFVSSDIEKIKKFGTFTKETYIDLLLQAAEKDPERFGWLEDINYNNLKLRRTEQNPDLGYIFLGDINLGRPIFELQ